MTSRCAAVPAAATTARSGIELSAAERAREWRLPYVRLIDAAGGSVRGFEEIGRTYLPDGNAFTTVDFDLLNTVPVVSAVLGAAAGLPALHAVLAHFNVMTERNAVVFPGGPPVVKAATGADVTKEELGGPHIHVHQSGTIDNLAVDEEDALAQVRRFLSYMPSSVDELPPRAEQRRPARPSRRVAARRRAAQPPPHVRPPVDHRGRRRPRLVLRDRPELRPRPRHRARSHRRVSPSA